MSNRTALILFSTIVIALLLLIVLWPDGAVFLARKFADLIHWIAFWR
ncbi:hypothetical protein [Ovoidimarina sediminis]|nr:hypothetical protein [Rhodophyticola sp. MJ-SS7]MDU8942224.1 hypothetical protein [Rhodophyticola sp. MJ-SS7]